eukprot:40511-Eustigmatos_ZCMA.PRE.1
MEPRPITSRAAERMQLRLRSSCRAPVAQRQGHARGEQWPDEQGRSVRHLYTIATDNTPPPQHDRWL